MKPLKDSSCAPELRGTGRQQACTFGGVCIFFCGSVQGIQKHERKYILLTPFNLNPKPQRLSESFPVKSLAAAARAPVWKARRPGVHIAAALPPKPGLGDTWRGRGT